MKTNLKLMAMAVIALSTLFSCSQGGGSDSMLFGSLPGEYEKMQAAKDALREEARNASSEAQMTRLMEKSNELKEEWTVKIENAAKSVDGRQIDITDGDIKVTSPISLTFRNFFSKMDLTPTFSIAGSAEAASDIVPEGKYPLAYYTVYIVGYGAENQELFTGRMGSIKAEITGDKAVVKAGTPVEFDMLQFSAKEVTGYEDAKSLKLEVRYN